MGYLRFVLWVVAVVLAAIRGRGPLVRLARALRRAQARGGVIPQDSRTVRLSEGSALVNGVPVRVVEQMNLYGVSIDREPSPYGGRLYAMERDRARAQHEVVEALRTEQAIDQARRRG